MFTQISWYVFIQLCQCHLELEKVKRPFIFLFWLFFYQKISITLQRMQAFSILSWVIVIDLSTSWLPPLGNKPPITMVDLLQAIDFWHEKIQPTYYRQSIFYMERFWHLPWANLTSCRFSFFLFLIPMYIFQISNVFYK